MYEEFHGTLLSEYYPKWIEEGTMQRDTLQKKKLKKISLNTDVNIFRIVTNNFLTYFRCTVNILNGKSTS